MVAWLLCPAATWRCTPKFHAATVCMTGVENSAVHTLDGRTFCSDMPSTALWRAAVGLDFFVGTKDALLPVKLECDFEELSDDIGLSDMLVRWNVRC